MIRVFVIRVLALALSIIVWVVSPRALDEERRLWPTVRCLIYLYFEKETHAMTRNRAEHREIRDAIASDWRNPFLEKEIGGLRL